MTSKRAYLSFIQNIIASYNAGKAFFVIFNNKKTQAIAGIFKKLGIVKGVKTMDYSDEDRSLFKIANKKKPYHIIVWLQYNERNPDQINDSISTLGFSSRPKPEGHNRPFHRILFIRKQSRINFSSKITRQDMFIHYKPKVNVIHILETQSGLITSLEAIQRKQSGYILCTIFL